MSDRRINILIIILLFTVSGIFSDNPDNPDIALNELVPLWKYAAGGELVSPPAVAENIYLYSEDRQIHAVSTDGDLLWRFKLTGRTADSLSVGPDGTVYACTAEGRLYAINSSGRQLWMLKCNGEPAGAPAVSADGTVYMGLKSGRLIAVSHTGFVRWQIETGTGFSGPPVIDDGEAVYVILSDGRIKSYLPWGSLNWETSIESAVVEASEDLPAAVHEHILYSAVGRKLRANNTEAELLWHIMLESECRGIVVFNKGLFIRLKNGSVQAVDFNGSLLWKGQGRGYETYPVSGGEHLFLLDGEGLVSMDFDGNIEGRGSVEGLILTQPVIGDQLLVCGSKQWVACAFMVSDSEGRGWSQEGGGASHAGSSGIGRWHFNEADYLENMDYLYLREYIKSSSVDDKLEALEEIGERIAADGTDKGERYLLHLLHLALTEGSMRLTVQRPGSLNDFPEVRREAARLLGLYGNFESVELLAAVLTEEKHYDVSAAIITALGELGTDYRYLPQWAIYNKVIKDNNGSAYDSLAWAAADAVGKINVYSGGLGSGYGYRTLAAIYRGNYSSRIRKKAGDVLRSMR